MPLLALLIALQGPTIVSDMWPGEGIPQFAAKTILRLHREPSRAAPWLRVTVGKGVLLQFDSTRYATMRSGQIIARSAGAIHGRVLGRVSYLSEAQYYADSILSREILYQRGDTVEYLQYRAEGTCVVRIKGDVIDAEDCPAFNPNGFAVRSEPDTEWWIWVRSATAQGWLLVDTTVVTQLKRRF